MKKRYILKLIFNFTIVILLIICLYNLLIIIRWEKDNRKTKLLFTSLRNETTILEKENINNSIFVNPDHDKNSLYWHYINMNLIDVNLDELSKKNTDVIGWIQVPGTNIDYPIVQSKDNKYYLDHSFDKSYNDAGWIFLDYRNDVNNMSKNNIIYGHARLDRTMFGSLRNTLKDTWFSNIDNRIIKLSTTNENSLWQIFSIYHIKTESYYITVKFEDDEFQNYINKSLDRSIYDFKTNVNTNDIILTLSTCFGDNQKLVVHAKLIKKEIKNP